jgi:hypothetical protein
MTHTRTNWKSRRGVIELGFGIAAAGMLMALTDQVGQAVVARADDYSTIVADIQGVEALGQVDLGDAAADFEGGSAVQGLADAFTGLDDTTVAPGEWLVLGGSDAITGAALPPAGWFDFDDTLITPTSWSDAVADATSLSSSGSDFLTAASDAFTGGDASTGLSDLLIAADFFEILSPQELALGLASSF